METPALYQILRDWSAASGTSAHEAVRKRRPEFLAPPSGKVLLHGALLQGSIEVPAVRDALQFVPACSSKGDA